METTTTTTVITDDLTQDEIKAGGWELRGLENGVSLHFTSLSNLVRGLLDGDLRGVPSQGWLREDMERQGLL